MYLEHALMYKNPTYKEMQFREVAGVWQRVDSQEPKPPILADVLNELQIIVDDNAQFLRVIRYEDGKEKTIEYRHYGGEIRINTWEIT